MSESEFNEAVLKEQLSKMAVWKQIVFLLSICQRLFPSFVVFARETGVDGEPVLKSAMQKAWNHLFKGEFIADLRNEADECESIAPDTEVFDSDFVSSALDAAIAVSSLMKAFFENDTNLIVEGASLARDSVDMYIQELENMDVNASNLESLILNHRLMQQELRRQREDLEFLRGLSSDISKSMRAVKIKLYDKNDSCLDVVV